MSGLLIATGRCTVCDHVFSFNPVRVPSYEGQPICEDCIELVNLEREKRGLKPWIVYPDSYGPIDPAEL